MLNDADGWMGEGVTVNIAVYTAAGGGELEEIEGLFGFSRQPEGLRRFGRLR